MARTPLLTTASNHEGDQCVSYGRCGASAQQAAGRMYAGAALPRKGRVRHEMSNASVRHVVKIEVQRRRAASNTQCPRRSATRTVRHRSAHEVNGHAAARCDSIGAHSFWGNFNTRRCRCWRIWA